MRSEASMTFLADSETLPISTIRSPAIAMSARWPGAPVPSTTVPFLIKTSSAIDFAPCGSLRVSELILGYGLGRLRFDFYSRTSGAVKEIGQTECLGSAVLEILD